MSYELTPFSRCFALRDFRSSWPASAGLPSSATLCQFSWDLPSRTRAYSPSLTASWTISPRPTKRRMLRSTSITMRPRWRSHAGEGGGEERRTGGAKRRQRAVYLSLKIIYSSSLRFSLSPHSSRILHSTVTNSLLLVASFIAAQRTLSLL